MSRESVTNWVWLAGFAVFCLPGVAVVAWVGVWLIARVA